MTALSNLRPQRWLLLALLILLPLAASAQNRPDRSERLKQALDLTDTQVALVTEALGDEVERGDLWNVAVALTPTLTDAQKEKLLARSERPMRNGRGLRGNREGRGERRGGPDAEAHAERQAAQLDAMTEALDLTDAQVQQIEALHAERQALREAHRALSEEQREQMRQLRDHRSGPDEIEAILTPEQREIARVHRALAAHMMHRARGQRSGLRH